MPKCKALDNRVGYIASGPLLTAIGQHRAVVAGSQRGPSGSVCALTGCRSRISHKADIAMPTQNPPSFWRLALIGALAHAVFTAVFWMGPLMYAAFGLGFKDRTTWTWLDSAIAHGAVPLANILISPGRSLSYDGLGGFALPALLTSATWGIGIAALVSCARRWRHEVARSRR